MSSSGAAASHARRSGTVGLFILLTTVHSMAFGQILQSETVFGDVRVDIDLVPALSRAQIISLATLGVDTRGSGARLMTLIVQNTTDRQIAPLYLAVTVEVSGIGTITRIDQRDDTPFSLRPGQVVVANNNQLRRGLPGVPERIELEGELTPQGEELINSLKGSVTLPDRLYTIDFSIYHGNNRLNGGVLVARTSVSLPDQELFTDTGFDLIAPGSSIGEPAQWVTHGRPVFRWEGNAAQTYRVVVVQAVEGQPAQALIQAALETAPVSSQAGVSITQDWQIPGELLEFEMVDVLVTGTSFSYPSVRVQTLQPGSWYYWQVLAVLQTPSGIAYAPSPIWQFGRRRAGIPLSELDEEIRQYLARFLPDRYHHLLLEGYKVEAASIEGEAVSGTQLLKELERLAQELEQGRLRFVD